MPDTDHPRPLTRVERVKLAARATTLRRQADAADGAVDQAAARHDRLKAQTAEAKRAVTTARTAAKNARKAADDAAADAADGDAGEPTAPNHVEVRPTAATGSGVSPA